MKKLLCSFAAYFIFGINIAHASVIYVKVTGEQIDWKNATVDGSNVVNQLVWQRSDRLNMLPIKSWTPAFKKNNTANIKFTSSLGVNFSTSFSNEGIDFRTSDRYVKKEGSLVPSKSCPPPSRVVGSDIILRGGESCALDYTLTQDARLRPFDFYRAAFRLPNLVQDLKSHKIPAGRYLASFNIPIAYYLNYEHNSINSYQMYQDNVMIILDYKPSFISNVSIMGNGQLKMDYDKDRHTVDGETTYNINVRGLFENGIRMSFSSSDKSDDFSLVSQNNQDKIPYSLYCDKCSEGNYPIKNGVMAKKFAKVPGSGNDINFNLKFYFDDLKFHEVDEGDYSDAVTVMFETDI